MSLQRPPRRPPRGGGLAACDVAEFLGIFLSKGCYCYGIIGNRKSKDQTWVPKHSTIGNNSSRGVFQRAREARFNFDWSHTQPDWWSDFSGSSLIPPANLLELTGKGWDPPLEDHKMQVGVVLQERFRVAGINNGNRNRHKSHNPKYWSFCWNRSIFKAFFPAFGPWLGFRLVPNLMPIFLAVSESALLVERPCLI